MTKPIRRQESVIATPSYLPIQIASAASLVATIFVGYAVNLVYGMASQGNRDSSGISDVVLRACIFVSICSFSSVYCLIATIKRNGERNPIINYSLARLVFVSLFSAALLGVNLSTASVRTFDRHSWLPEQQDIVRETWAGWPCYIECKSEYADGAITKREIYPLIVANIFFCLSIVLCILMFRISETRQIREY